MPIHITDPEWSTAFNFWSICLLSYKVDTAYVCLFFGVYADTRSHIRRAPAQLALNSQTHYLHHYKTYQNVLNDL